MGDYKKKKKKKKKEGDSTQRIFFFFFFLIISLRFITRKNKFEWIAGILVANRRIADKWCMFRSSIYSFLKIILSESKTVYYRREILLICEMSISILVNIILLKGLSQALK